MLTMSSILDWIGLKLSPRTGSVTVTRPLLVVTEVVMIEHILSDFNDHKIKGEGRLPCSFSTISKACIQNRKHGC
jgi:hypothetical protein